MTSIKEVLVRCAEELEESIENEGKLASFKQAAAMARSALAQLDSADARSGNLRRVVLDLLNGVTPAVENLACHQEQADADGCMVKVSRQALDEVLSAVNEVAVQAATSLSTGLLPNASPGNGAEKVDSLMDSQYLAGAKAGWNAAHTDDPDASYQRIVDGRKDHLKGLRTFNEALHSTSAAGETREPAWQANLREAWAALAMIRETVETLGPVGAIQASEHLSGPTFMHEAEAIVQGIQLMALTAGETTSSDGQRENQPEKRTGPHRASGETNSGSTGDSELTRSAVCPSEAADVLAMKEACKRAVYEADYLKDALANIDAIEIDKLSPEVKADASPPDWKQDQAETTRIKPPATAEGGRDEPVAIKPLEWDKHPDEDEWFSHDHGLYDVSEYLVYKSPVSTTAWCLKVRGILLDEDFLGPDAAKAAARDDYEQRIRSALHTHPASPPDVEAIARIIDPEAFEKWDDAQGSWRKDEAKVACWPAEEKADAIAALIAGGR